MNLRKGFARLRRTLANAFASRHRAFWIGVNVLALVLMFGFGVGVGASAFGEMPHLPFFLGAHSASEGIEPGHGLIGSISAIERDTITVTDKRFGNSRIVRVSADTIIERRHGNRTRFEELQVGDHVIIIGAPVEGMIQARYVGVTGDHPVNMTPEPSSENLLDDAVLAGRVNGSLVVWHRLDGGEVNRISRSRTSIPCRVHCITRILPRHRTRQEIFSGF